jgi:hypothetical protein
MMIVQEKPKVNRFERTVGWKVHPVTIGPLRRLRSCVDAANRVVPTPRRIDFDLREITPLMSVI